MREIALWYTNHAVSIAGGVVVATYLAAIVVMGAMPWIEDTGLAKWMFTGHPVQAPVALLATILLFLGLLFLLCTWYIQPR